MHYRYLAELNKTAKGAALIAVLKMSVLAGRALDNYNQNLIIISMVFINYFP